MGGGPARASLSAREARGSGPAAAQRLEPFPASLAAPCRIPGAAPVTWNILFSQEEKKEQPELTRPPILPDSSHPPPAGSPRAAWRASQPGEGAQGCAAEPSVAPPGLTPSTRGARGPRTGPTGRLVLGAALVLPGRPWASELAGAALCTARVLQGHVLLHGLHFADGTWRWGEGGRAVGVGAAAPQLPRGSEARPAALRGPTKRGQPRGLPGQPGAQESRGGTGGRRPGVAAQREGEAEGRRRRGEPRRWAGPPPRPLARQRGPRAASPPHLLPVPPPRLERLRGRRPRGSAEAPRRRGGRGAGGRGRGRGGGPRDARAGRSWRAGDLKTNRRRSPGATGRGRVPPAARPRGHDAAPASGVRVVGPPCGISPARPRQRSPGAPGGEALCSASRPLPPEMREAQEPACSPLSSPCGPPLPLPGRPPARLCPGIPGLAIGARRAPGPGLWVLALPCCPGATPLPPRPALRGRGEREKKVPAPSWASARPLWLDFWPQKLIFKNK